MQYVIGLAIMAVSVIACFVMRKRAAGDLLEVQYMQTTSIADAAEIFGNMEPLSQNYRHYVELKGVAGAEGQVIGPFSGQNVAYYSNHCFSVNEVVTVTNTNGNHSTSTSRQENEVSAETSVAPVYITDQSCPTPVYLDVASFRENATLLTACNRMQQNLPGRLDGASGGYSAAGSNIRFTQIVRFDPPAAGAMPGSGGAAALDNFFFRRGTPPRPGGMNRRPGASGGQHAPARRPSAPRPGRNAGGQPPIGMGGFGGIGNPGGLGRIGGFGGGIPGGIGNPMPGGSSSENRFLGYRLVENVIPLGQSVYVLGELYRQGDRLYIGRASEKGKPSFLSCKSEETLTREIKQKKSAAITVAVVGILIGLAFIWLFS